MLEKADVTTIICEEKFEPWFENLEHVTVIVSKSGPDFGLDWMLRDLEDNEITDGVGTWMIQLFSCLLQALHPEAKALP